MSAFELTADCETIISTDDLTIYYDRDNVERAVYACDMDGLPLPHCRPESLGYGLVMLDYIGEGVAIAEVTDLGTLIGRPVPAVTVTA